MERTEIAVRCSALLGWVLVLATHHRHLDVGVDGTKDFKGGTKLGLPTSCDCELLFPTSIIESMTQPRSSRSLMIGTRPCLPPLVLPGLQGDRSTNYFFLTPDHVTTLVMKASHLSEN